MRATGDSISLFKLMFPDSEIAKTLQLQKTKVQYAVVHGLGPYFENELRKEIAARIL